MKNFINEFKTFLNKGNALEMAIGVVIGGAFSSIVNSLVNDVITPVIGMIVGGFDFSDIKIPLGGDSNIMIGAFIQSVINFILIGFTMFIVVKSMNKFDELKKKKDKTEEVVKEDSDEVKLLKSIDAQLKKIK